MFRRGAWLKALVLTSLTAQLSTAAPALAKEATCYSTDDGQYPCEFVALDGSGSFEVSAPGHPSFALIVDSPGIAWVFSTFEAGGRSVALPGPYQRSVDDPACWQNSDTLAELCAW